MNFDTIPEHEILRDSVRAFLDQELPEETIRAYDRARKIPRSIWPRLAAQVPTQRLDRPPAAPLLRPRPLH